MMKETWLPMMLTTKIVRDQREDGVITRNGLSGEKNQSRNRTLTRTRGDKGSISVNPKGHQGTEAAPPTRRPHISLAGMKLLHLSDGNLRTNRETGGKPWHRRAVSLVK